MSSRDHHLIEITADGTPTIKSSVFKTEYHSKHGAITESQYVFLNKGLHFFLQNNHKKEIRVLEFGFGTGLNALLTAECASDKLSIHYTTLELYPLTNDVCHHYADVMWKDGRCNDKRRLFEKLHEAEWDRVVRISPYFIIEKLKCDFKEYEPTPPIDVVYYDAFGPGTQPELWGKDIFKAIFQNMNASGIMTTFCVQGAFRRMLTEVGFDWEKLPGPPGKREMLRVFKDRSYFR